MPNPRSIVLITALIAALALAQTAAPPVEPMWAGGGPDPSSWYMNVTGVLRTDRYRLYPYSTTTNLTLGFSRYGELIDARDTSLGKGVSLLYGNVDVFAPDHDALSSTIPKNLWFQGWLMEIRYTNTIFNVLRRIVVTAQFGDLSTSSYGGPWIAVNRTANPSGAGDPAADLLLQGYQYNCAGNPPTCILYGTPMWSGRKSIAYSWNPTVGQWQVSGIAPVFQSDIQIMYEDDRRFIAMMRINITDQIGPTTPALPLVNMTIIIDFNKVNKYVTVIKHLVSSLDSKYGVQMAIQLSDRGEIDLGNRDVGYNQLLHFFTHGTCGAVDALIQGQPTVYRYGPWGVQAPGIAGLSCYLPPPIVNDRFDLLQSVNIAADKVFFAAFWPVVNDWDSYAWPLRGRPMGPADLHRIDSSQAPLAGMRPYYIAEWDFTLVAKDITGPRQFRAVSVYGIVDNNGQLTAANYATTIHPEIRYYLMQVFGPYVLRGQGVPPVADDFITHSRIRLYNLFIATGTQTLFPLRYHLPLVGFASSGVTYVPFAWVVGASLERYWEDLVVLRDGVRVNVPVVACDPDGIAGPFGTGYACVSFAAPPPNGARIEVYFTVSRKTPFRWEAPTDADGDGLIDPGEIVGDPLFLGAFEWVVVGRDSHPVDSAGAANMVEAIHEAVLHPDGEPRVVQYSGLDMQHVDLNVPYLMRAFSPPATGPRSKYYFSGLRAALGGDWANLEPVASGSIVAVGGPGANLVAEYFNSLAPVIYAGGSGHFSSGGTPFRFVAPGLWQVPPAILSNSSIGVVYVYRDLNGTTGVVIYGVSGETTWAIAQSFYQPTLIDGVFRNFMQYIGALPAGAQAVVVKVNWINNPFWVLPNTAPDRIPRITTIAVLGPFSRAS